MVLYFSGHVKVFIDFDRHLGPRYNMIFSEFFHTGCVMVRQVMELALHGYSSMQRNS